MLKLRSPFIVMLMAVLLTGTAINVENSGNPVDSASEAVERVVNSVKAGYSQGVFTSFKLND